MADPRASQLARIRRAARIVELRLRLGRVFRIAPYVLVAGLGLAGATLALRKALPAAMSEASARRILVAIGVLSLGALLAAVLRRLPPRAGTLALDRVHALSGRLTNGIAFATKAESERSPLMEVAIDDACAHSDALSPRRAAPLEAPRDLLAPFCVAAGVAAIAMLEVRTILPPAPRAATIDALTMAPDDLDLFRDAAKELSKRDQTPEVQAAIDRFNQLIEDIAQKRLDRTEAFRRMEAIERELLKGAEADEKALEDALEETARELKRSDLARPIGDSLEKKDLEKAKKELEKLAEKLRDKKKKPSKADLDKLRQALERAANRRKEALAALEEKRSEAREDLLKKKQKAQPDGGAPDEQERRLLKKKERELERLDREAERQQQVQRKLDKLDRDLAKAAEDLMRDLGASAEDLEQAAEDINRLEQDEMSDKEKEELRQKLEEMREVLRQQGQGGQQRMARMKRFGKRARGDQSDSGLDGEGQEPGGTQKGRGEGEEGEGEGEGQDGKGMRGKKGEGQGQGGQQWVIGPGGKKILIPGMGGREGQGQGQGQGKGKDGQGNGGGEGKGIGSEHDGNVAGKRTDPKMDTVDVQAQGLDTKQGPSNSEVILSAAERGFRGGSYKKVFRDYHTVAEQQINKDQIPDGYRFYVHRYFQLIRPRD